MLGKAMPQITLEPRYRASATLKTTKSYEAHLQEQTHQISILCMGEVLSIGTVFNCWVTNH